MTEVAGAKWKVARVAPQSFNAEHAKDWTMTGLSVLPALRVEGLDQ
jgi:hypothetical protein